eukprot:CAMPEP_0118649380 /NCGR_PEP_ID=MMETSP0785-20121206/9672_1 /TAXON_ID=91992 /ORGANISM="Bolidomonas pacifica, Strain CCMP 1866" /LENGTH=243 /DNA_ID=CAMNT_0006541663 /DNA_START=189 /DNA_END=920 /DNA_ORIENTATION=+
MAGNTHYISKEYDQAIECYSKALSIQSDHRYYSNRSACYFGKKDYKAAAADAEECIRLKPNFIKGYYRLVTALTSAGDYDKALQAAKNGLAVDEGNAELLKQVRIIKSKKAAASERERKGVGVNKRRDGTVDEKEVLELQDQINATRREMSSVEQYLMGSKREQKMAALTAEQLGEISPTTKMYLGYGKAFVLCSRDDAITKTKNSITEYKKREAELEGKMEYLKKKASSQMGNFKELVEGAR